MGKLIDITGQKFGRLTVIKLDHIVNKKHGPESYWLCKCDCGNEKIIRKDHITGNKTLSCGCLQKEKASKINSTHHLSKSRIYYIWASMKSRCSLKTDTNYARYGAKGIKVCDEWQNFEPFYNWAINNGYKDNLSIDRIDVYKDYCPENCRWANRIQQANNKSNNTKIKYNNEEHTLAEWAKILGYSYSTMCHRYYRNWDVEKMMKQPQRRTLCK